MGISVLLALLLVKTRASGTRNGLFEANIDTACLTLSDLPAYLPYRKKLSAGIKQKTPTSLMSGSRIRKWQLPTLPPGGAVPSAMVSLTSLFGMGRGGSSPL